MGFSTGDADRREEVRKAERLKSKIGEQAVASAHQRALRLAISALGRPDFSFSAPRSRHLKWR